jgi:hypothetical protein
MADGQGWLQWQRGLCFHIQKTNNKQQNTKGNPMAKYQHFEELPVWQEAARLYNAVLDLLEEPNAPLSPGFRNQLDRVEQRRRRF